MAKDFFRDLGTSVFKPFGDFISGGVTALQPGRVQQMQELLKSEAGQTLLMKARAASLDRGEGYYGGRGVDPYVKGAEDLGKIRVARDKVTDEEGKITPELAAYFDAAEKSVLDRINRGKKAEDRTDFVGPPAPIRKPTLKRDNREYFAPGAEFLEMSKEYDKSKDRIISPKQRKPTELELQGMLPAGRKVESDIMDYFQAPTDTVPESNIPKTYPQMGIESIDDMAVLEEMQKALPDVDMRDEYESDPEMMKKLMELWRAKKLNKSNLHKAFSMIQQSAQQALGIR